MEAAGDMQVAGNSSECERRLHGHYSARHVVVGFCAEAFVRWFSAPRIGWHRASARRLQDGEAAHTHRELGWLCWC